MAERSTIGPELVKSTSEIMDLNREVSSHDLEPVEEFEMGDHVFLKVIPKRGVVRFGKQGELSPRYIGPFEILERVGTIAYRLVLLPRLSGVQEVFHVSKLRRYTPHPTRVLDWGELIVDAKRDLRGGTCACLRQPGSSFTTQNYKARVCFIATLSSGVGNLGMPGHDACWLSLAVARWRYGS